MAATSLPFHDVLGDNSPAVVVDLLAGLIGAALAVGADTIHPIEVVIGTGARVNLTQKRGIAPHPVTSAPELARAGASEATLVYAVGALGAMAALRDLPAAPRTEREHTAWVHTQCARLRSTWGEALGAEAAIRLIARCLAYEPAERPTAEDVAAMARSAGLSSEDGLVTRTGYAPPTLSDTPAPSRSRRQESQEAAPLVLTPGGPNRPDPKAARASRAGLAPDGPSWGWTQPARPPPPTRSRWLLGWLALALAGGASAGLTFVVGAWLVYAARNAHPPTAVVVDVSRPRSAADLLPPPKAEPNAEPAPEAEPAAVTEPDGAPDAAEADPPGTGPDAAVDDHTAPASRRSAPKPTPKPRGRSAAPVAAPSEPAEAAPEVPAPAEAAPKPKSSDLRNPWN